MHSDSGHLSRSRDLALLISGIAVAVAAALLILALRGGPDPLEPLQPVQDSRPEGAGEAPDEGARASEPDLRQVPAFREAPPLPLEAPAVAQAARAGTGSTEALRCLRLEELEKYWEQVAVARDQNHEGDLLKVSALVTFGMKPLLDEAGFGEKQVGTRTEYPPDKHYLFINGLDYFVPHGQFPVVDRYFQLWREWSARSEAAKELDPTAKVPFTLDEPFLISLEAMKNRALEAIERRAEMY
jgi:hypothetical protein